MWRTLPTRNSWKWLQVFMPMSKWRYLSSSTWTMLLSSWMDCKCFSHLLFYPSFSSQVQGLIVMVYRGVFLVQKKSSNFDGQSVILFWRTGPKKRPAVHSFSAKSLFSEFYLFGPLMLRSLSYNTKSQWAEMQKSAI